MALQESISSDTTLFDFSTALLRANNKDQNLQFKGDKSVNISANDYTSPGNHNLSSLLSQIQDDGPAHTDSVKPGNIFNRTENNNTTAPGSQQDAGLKCDDVVSVTSGELQQDRLTNADISETKTSLRSWLFFFLILLCAAVWIAVTMFRLDLRTSELEESLNLYGVSVQDSINSQTQNENLLLSIKNTSETLQSVQQELQLIKTDYADLDDKYAESIANGTLPQIDKEIAPVKDNVAALRQEILLLKSELQTVKTKLITTNEDINSADKVITSSGLTVNLLSLTNKTKVEKLAEQLQTAGFFPLIEQAVVKNDRVYRLSVSGFSSRNEAKAFIDKAAKLYGIKDGWIRKS